MSGSGFGEFYSALVGDAAHPARPSFGQGANMALEDAVQLGLVLREADSVRGLPETSNTCLSITSHIFGHIRFFVSRSWCFWGLIYTICTIINRCCCCTCRGGFCMARLLRTGFLGGICILHNIFVAEYVGCISR